MFENLKTKQVTLELERVLVHGQAFVHRYHPPQFGGKATLRAHDLPEQPSISNTGTPSHHVPQFVLSAGQFEPLLN